MAKLFVKPEQVHDKNIIIEDKDDIRHIIKVLRLREGDLLDISDTQDWEYSCEISIIEKDFVETKILDKQKFAREPEIKVTLFQGIPKSGKMEMIIQKCTELGINNIVPVWNERTVVTDKGNFSKKIDRWQKVADEAAKQCKRGIIPTIENDLKFEQMASMLANFDLVIFPYENEDDFSIKDLLSNIEIKPNTIAIVIGPEGGFSDLEFRIMQNADIQPVTLGKTILRTETAGMATLAMAMYALEL